MSRTSVQKKKGCDILGAEIDRLEIQIEAEASKANRQLNNLVGKLEKVSNALSGLNSHGLSGLADSVSKFAQASTQLSNVKTADFTKLAKNIGKLSALNTQQIYGASSAMHTLTTAMNSLGNSSKSSTQVTQLANAISQLGSANAKKAATNLPVLATAMNNFMTVMAKAPQVSSNVIQMTRALANLSAQGAKVGTAGNSLTTSVNRIGTSMEKTTKKTRSFSSVLGSFYQKYFWVMHAGTKLWDSVKASMSYVEVLNYFDSAFGQVAKSAVSQWEKSGEDSAEAYYNSFSDRAKQLTTKMTGFTIADSGMLQSTGGKSLGINPSQLMNYQAMFVQMSNSMGMTAETSLKVSTALTEIGADLASVKNMNFDKVWTDMASGLAGMSRTLDKYGANIRNVNLQQKLTELGINANITALNQNEKALLRTIILLDSTRYAWGDLGETIKQPANQLRLLESNFANLARTVGNIFLPIVTKVLPYLNSVVIALQRLAEWMVKLIGFEDFDWGGSNGIGGAEFDDLIGGIGDIEDGLNSSTDAAKKLKTHLLGIDELNVVNNDEDSGSGSIIGGLGGSAGLLEGALDKILEEYQTAWDEAFANMEIRFDGFADKVAEAFKQGGLSGVGEYFSKKLTEALRNIKWESVYAGAGTFGTGLANFLNGLIKPETFGTVGSTIASSLNTALHVLNTFGETFEWEEFGKSLAQGVHDFFVNWDANLTGETFSTFSTGMLDSISGFFTTLSENDTFEEIGQKLVDLIFGIEWGKVVWSLANFFESMTNALIDFPFDFGTGIAEAIVEKITGADVEFSKPKWVEGLGEKLLEYLIPELEIIDLLQYIFGSNENETTKNYGGGSHKRGDGSSLGDIFSTWWTDSVEPWFNPELWHTLAEGIRLGLEMKWAEITEWWQNTAIYTWWTENVEPWFTAETWQTMLDNVKISFKTKWDETANQWKISIKKWWDGDIEPWFTKEKWNFGGIKDGLENAFNNAISIIKSIWNGFANWINEALKIDFSGFEKSFNVLGKEIKISLPKFEVQLGKLPTFQTGGFPEDGLFMANHSELVGKFSNGKTAVANNEMIVAGIEEAAYRGFSRAYAENDREVSLLEELIDAVREGRTISIDGRELVSAYDERKARNGFSFT